MTDLYGGSAGGQPRLLIPTIDQFQDPAVTVAMNAILRWANTLIVGGGGGVTGWFFGTGTGPSDSGLGTQVTWTPVFSSGFGYFNVAGDTLESLPTDSLTIFLFGFRYFYNGINIVPPDLTLLLTNGSVIIGEPAHLHYDTGSNLANVDETRVGFAIVDDDSPHSALPYDWESANTSSISLPMDLYLGIVSIEKAA